ncbi:hypothetical protein Leryth_026903 [Lithospermum erythrorhizon]|nr:hypothetical protein Leryth_026903 [Lithospermum erythrorhizon]
MDKISKRSKGYAFIEYTTEEAASTALREMNGKIISSWILTVVLPKKILNMEEDAQVEIHRPFYLYVYDWVETANKNLSKRGRRSRLYND